MQNANFLTEGRRKILGRNLIKAGPGEPIVGKHTRTNLSGLCFPSIQHRIMFNCRSWQKAWTFL